MVLEAEWTNLRKLALEELRTHGVCSPDAPQTELLRWDDTVLRFRKLREALTAADAAADLRCQVYELSAVVCAAARNMAELLKCLQQLVNNIYPALIRQQQQQHHQQQQQRHQQQQQPQQQGPAGATVVEPVNAAAAMLQDLHLDKQQQQQQKSTHLLYNSDCSHMSDTSSSSSSSSCGWQGFLAQDIQQRRVEASAALLLYFACIPRQPVRQELIKHIRQASRTVVAAKPASQQQQHHQQQQWNLRNQQQRQEQQQEPQLCRQQQAFQPPLQSLLLLQPSYQLAVRAASAVLNCHWVHFITCYNSSTGILVRTVMEAHIQRLRIQAVHTVAVAYRMIPSDALLRWIGLVPQLTTPNEITSLAAALIASPQVGGAEAGGGLNSSAANANADANAATDSLQSRTAVRNALLRLLLAAAEGGSKGARIAFEQCSTTDEAVLPDTLMFRS